MLFIRALTSVGYGMNWFFKFCFPYPYFVKFDCTDTRHYGWLEKEMNANRFWANLTVAIVMSNQSYVHRQKGTGFDTNVSEIV